MALCCPLLIKKCINWTVTPDNTTLTGFSCQLQIEALLANLLLMVFVGHFFPSVESALENFGSEECFYFILFKTLR